LSRRCRAVGQETEERADSGAVVLAEREGVDLEEPSNMIRNGGLSDWDGG
jgi:hypothetical protein